MQLNKVRVWLLIFNIIFFLGGISLYTWLKPKLVEVTHDFVINDSKARLTNNSAYIIDAVSRNALDHNFGLTVYTIPTDSRGKIRTDVYAFYIVDPSGKAIYATDERYKNLYMKNRFPFSLKTIDYIESGFSVRDTSGITTGVLGNKIYYITARFGANEKTYLMVYEIDVREIERSVERFQNFFFFIYGILAIALATQSIYVDKQYAIIVRREHEILDASQIIKEYSNYLQTVFNTVRDVIFVTDLIGTIIDANDAVKDVFGYTVSEVKGKSIELLITSNCFKMNENYLLCNGKTANGDNLKCEIFQSQLPLLKGRKLQILVIQDVTEREHLKEQLYASITVTTDTMKAIAGKL